VQTFAPYVQDLLQEIHRSPIHFVSFVQICVMLVLLNVENFQHTTAVKNAQKHAKDVLSNAAKWVKSNQ
jgi:hypothetical protein